MSAGTTTISSLRARHEAIQSQFAQNDKIVQESIQIALQELIPALQLELELQDEDLLRTRAFLEDQVTVFRFCRRARFSIPAALKLLHATVVWRLTQAAHLSISTVAPLYLSRPLFFFHPALLDRFGRPCAVLNLKHVSRTEDGELDALKDFVRLGWEIGRRWLTDLSRQCQKKAEEGGEEDGKDKVMLQMVLIVDLEGAGMSNLEVELLPFFMDLLKNHFPGMVGAIFVLNYGWMYAGMWQLAKRVLPRTALERILFPSKAELLEFFEEDHLLKEHGGKVEYQYTPSNPIMDKYGRLPSTSGAIYPSPAPSPPSALSPLHISPSVDSMGDEVFHTPFPSRPTTPSATGPPTSGILSRRSSHLSMTSVLKSPSPISAPISLPDTGADGEAGGSIFSRWRVGRRNSGAITTTAAAAESAIRRVTSFADLQDRLAETQAAIGSDSSDEEFEGPETEEGEEEGEEDEEEYQRREEAAKEYAKQLAEAGETEGLGIQTGERVEEDGEQPTTTTSHSTSVRTSAYSSRATSRNVSRATSRETSPMRRRDGERFYNKASRFTGMHHVSPYNTSNPYYGYPAFVPPTSLDPSRVPRPHYLRRRKRDLVRTLTYLAVLRFLALHRNIQWHISVVLNAILRITGLRSPKKGGKEKEKERHVRWGDSVTSPTSERRTSASGDIMRPVTARASSLSKKQRKMVDARLVYALLFVILVRSSTFHRVVKVLAIDLPRAVLPQHVVDAVASKISGLSTTVATGTRGKRKRDVVKGLLGIPTEGSLRMRVKTMGWRGLTK
ncbi:hypothetical protein T439DRAFT_349160 [Meredithblackwellia eburnea MCA 4105]